MHKLIKIEKSKKRIQETISFYNNIKFDVDVMDDGKEIQYEIEIFQMVPLDIFQHFGLTGINAQILYKETADKQNFEAGIFIPISQNSMPSIKNREKKTKVLNVLKLSTSLDSYVKNLKNLSSKIL